MSKQVKEMIIDQFQGELKEVKECLVVSVAKLSGVKNTELRARLRKKNIHCRFVKNSLLRRATLNTPLASAFKDLTGSAAIIWGGEDIVALAKEVIAVSKEKPFAGFAPLGGSLDGEILAAGQVEEVSKWPSRQEQLSLLLGQITGVGAKLNGQLIAMGGKLASQIKKKSEAPEGEGSAEGTAEEAAPAAS